MLRAEHLAPKYLQRISKLREPGPELSGFSEEVLFEFESVRRFTTPCSLLPHLASFEYFLVRNFGQLQLGVRVSELLYLIFDRKVAVSDPARDFAPWATLQWSIVQRSPWILSSVLAKHLVSTHFRHTSIHH